MRVRFVLSLRSAFAQLVPCPSALVALTASVVGAAVSPPALAQSGSPSGGVTERELIEIPPNVRLARLIDLASAASGRPVQYDPDVVRGEITLRLDGGIKGEDLWPLVEHVLRSRGLTTISGGTPGSLEVVRLQDAAELALPKAAAEADPVGFRTVVYAPRFVDAQRLVETVSPLLSRQGSTVLAFSNGRFLLLRDLSARIEIAEGYIEQIDAESAAIQTEWVSLQHTDAEAIASQVTDAVSDRATLFGRPIAGVLHADPETASVLIQAPAETIEIWRTYLQGFDRPKIETTVVYSIAPLRADEVAAFLNQTIDDDRSPTVVVDTFTNSLVVTAVAKTHTRIRESLDRLSSRPELQSRTTRSLQVSYRGVAEIRQLLDEVLDQESVVDGEEASTPEDGVRIVEDPVGNRLLVTGTRDQVEEVADALTLVDTPHPQVMLEVVIVSLTEGETFDLGAEIRAETNNADNTTLLSSIFGLGPSGDGTGFGTGSGFTVSSIVPGEYDILLRALATINEGRNVSRPKILVSNNEPATFQSVVQEPFASVNASDTVATTSFGGTQDAGTTINVTPQIMAGDRIRLEYSVSQSAFTGESADPSIPPPRQQNQVQSIVTVPDAHAVVVSGLVVETEAEAVSKVPLLGDIPGLGELFKTRSRSRSRSRFFIFIKPDIVRNDSFEDLRYLSEKDLVGVDLFDGPPPLEPRIIR